MLTSGIIGEEIDGEPPGSAMLFKIKISRAFTPVRA
jgi:hypothetical protein